MREKETVDMGDPLVLLIDIMAEDEKRSTRIGEYPHRNGETDTPTRPGDYWVDEWCPPDADDPDDPDVPYGYLGFLEIYHLHSTMHGGLIVTTCGSEDLIEANSMIARWWGPIPRPAIEIR